MIGELSDKKCSKCGKEKELTEFYRNKSLLSGYNSACKECENEYRLKTREKRKEYQIKYYNDNQDEMKKRSLKYKRDNPDYQKEYDKNYDRSKKILSVLKWKRKNKEYYNNYYKKYCYEKRKIDINYKLSLLIRSRMRHALNRNTKSLSIMELIDCSVEEFKQYIKKQFLPEMNWDNWGPVWELDHIIPCASFNLINEEEQKKCFHYTNYQPLFKTTKIAESFGYKDYIGNRNKKDKYIIKSNNE